MGSLNKLLYLIFPSVILMNIDETIENPFLLDDSIPLDWSELIKDNIDKLVYLSNE